MSDSQYAVLHFDVKTMTMAGDAMLIFDTLPEAESHCRAQVASNAGRGCRILDHEGKIVQTFADDEVYGQHHGRPAAKRNVMIGAACLAAGMGGVALDAWLEWRLILGVLIGVRFLWMGTVRMAEGISGLMDERAGR
jgi:hypothetical protein